MDSFVRVEFKCSKSHKELEDWFCFIKSYAKRCNETKETTYQIYEPENKGFATYYGLEVVYELYH